MSSICSKHLRHEPGCELCEAGMMAEVRRATTGEAGSEVLDIRFPVGPQVNYGTGCTFPPVHDIATASSAAFGRKQ